MGRFLIAGLALAALAIVGVTGWDLERQRNASEVDEELLYLPNGDYLRVASLGQQSLLADLIYLWAIQYYANYDRADRYRYVEHVFGEVITELDPHYVDAYWMGALILTVEARDLQGGLRLLDKGIENNPEHWVLPYLAGWECFYADQHERAADYFETASAVPGAPPFVRRMRAGMTGRAGDLQRAIQLWLELLDDPDSDAATQAIARRQLRTLRLRYDMQRLREAVERFRNDNGRLPRNLEELRRRSYIEEVPVGADGLEYRYDPQTGDVSRGSDRIVGER